MHKSSAGRNHTVESSQNPAEPEHAEETVGQTEKELVLFAQQYD